MSNLASRILVAIVLAPVALALVYLGGWAMTALGVVAAVIGIHELSTMARRHRPIVIAGVVGVVGMVVGAHAGGLQWVLYALVACTFLSFLLTATVQARESATVMLGTTLLGPVWIGVGVACLVLLRDLGPGDDGLTIVLAVLLGTWMSDIAAYFGGRALGRRKLAPTISPKKTVEGFLIGVVAGVATTWWVLYGVVDGDQRIAAVGVGLAVALAAPFGDLFESFLKRDLGVKDSGTVLGGHGGVLDRIDALLFSGPAALIAVDLLLR